MSKHYHLIGIGGIGMSGIAQLLLRSGFRVSGSDLKENRVTEELKNAGASISVGHRPENISGADIVVYSSAIKEDNPELAEARRKGVAVIMRAQALAGLMKDKSVIAVAGSHGKTTITSMVSYMMLEAGFCPTVAIGGILKNIDTNACLGNGKFFVAEADESDGSFLFYQPEYSIVTNIDKEHLDYYKDFEHELEAFRAFMDRTGENGCIFACDDDPNLKRILGDCKKKHILFGLKESADVYPLDIKLKGLTSEFDCIYKGKLLGHFRLELGGRHNISNALAVIALGLELGIDLNLIKNALGSYKGAQRRLEIKFSSQDITVIDDYAHHPTEIKATLAAARNLKAKRLIAVFQPHRYSRTQLLLDEFSGSFDDADYLIITDIYPASEQKIEGVDGKLVCAKIKERSPEKAVHFMVKEEIIEHIGNILQPGDLVIILGAGDIVKIGEGLVGRLKGQR